MTLWACVIAAAPLFAQTVKGPIAPEPAFVVPELDLPSAEKTLVPQALPRTPDDEPLKLQSAADWVEEQLAARPRDSRTPKLVVEPMPPFVIQRFSEGSAFDVSADHAKAPAIAPQGGTYELAPRAPIARAALRPLTHREAVSPDPKPASFNWRTWRQGVAAIAAISAVAVAAGYSPMNGVILFVWSSTIFTLFQRIVHEVKR